MILLATLLLAVFSQDPIAEYATDDEIGIGQFYTVDNPISKDFCIGFEFHSRIPCKIQGDDNEHWFDGCGMIDGDVPSDANDFGISLGRHGEVIFGVGNPDISIKSAPGYADGSRHRVCAKRVMSSGKISLYIDDDLIGVEYGSLLELDSSPRLELGFTQHHPGYEFEGVLKDVKFYDSFPCCLPPDWVEADEAMDVVEEVVKDLTPVADCPALWTQMGTADSDNWTDDPIFCMGKSEEPSIEACAAKCDATLACSSFSYVGGSMYHEFLGLCALYKREEPNTSYGDNTRFCMKNTVLPKCEDENGVTCGYRENECWDLCGQAEGYCDACSTRSGLQGACCRQEANAGSVSVCSQRVNPVWFITSGYHQCVVLDV